MAGKFREHLLAHLLDHKMALRPPQSTDGTQIEAERESALPRWRTGAITMTKSSIFAAVLISALFPTLAIAEEQGQASCTSEAFRVCWRAMPDRHSVFLCLLDHRRTLKEPCRSKIMHEARLRTHHGVMDRRPQSELERN
jgi:hypothetical protein